MSIPIAIIAGYLGSGKTTLINRVLRSNDSLQGLAVLVNDFGQVNVDAQLIRSANPDGSIYGLENGCVCCSLEDGFASTLDQLLKLPIDRVLLEASGVGLPVKLRAQCAYPGFRAGTCLVMVDAANYTLKTQDKYVGTLVKTQVATADALMISKGDLAPTFQLDSPLPRYTTQEPDLLPVLWQRLWHRRRTSSDVLDADSTAEFSTLTLPLQFADADAAQRFVAALPDYVERAKGVVATPGGHLLVQRTATELDCQFTQVAAAGLVLIYPSAFKKRLEQHLRHHAPQSVREFLPVAPR